MLTSGVVVPSARPSHRRTDLVHKTKAAKEAGIPLTDDEQRELSTRVANVETFRVKNLGYRPDYLATFRVTPSSDAILEGVRSYLLSYIGRLVENRSRFGYLSMYKQDSVNPLIPQDTRAFLLTFIKSQEETKMYLGFRVLFEQDPSNSLIPE